MIRSSTDPSAAHAFMLVSHERGVAFQRRLGPGDVTLHTAGPLTSAPYWVRLTREGPLIIGSTSPDGINWTEVGRDTFAFSEDVFVGLAVTSHDNAALATATFDGVTLVP